jgi:hypothetical protein
MARKVKTQTDESTIIEDEEEIQGLIDEDDDDDEFLDEIMGTEAIEVHPGGEVYLGVAGFRKDENDNILQTWKNEKGEGKYYSVNLAILDDPHDEISETEYGYVNLFLTKPQKHLHSGNTMQARLTRYNYGVFFKAFGENKPLKSSEMQSLIGRITENKATIAKKWNKVTDRYENTLVAFNLD